MAAVCAVLAVGACGALAATSLPDAPAAVPSRVKPWQARPLPTVLPPVRPDGAKAWCEHRDECRMRARNEPPVRRNLRVDQVPSAPALRTGHQSATTDTARTAGPG